MQQQKVIITENFFLELFRLSIKDKNFFELCQSNIKYSFFPDEQHKKLWKTISKEWEHSTKLTIGALESVLSTDTKTLKLLVKVSKVDIPSFQNMKDGLKEFLLLGHFQEFYDKFAETFNSKGKEESVALTKDFIYRVETLQLDTQLETFEPLFKGFVGRNLRRTLKPKVEKIFIPTGIDLLDRVIEGIGLTDMLLFCAQSGKGKTRFLRHLGIVAARLGFKVLHIQLEGAQDECEIGYDAAWTAQSHRNIEFGHFDLDLLEKFEKIARQQRGEVYIKAFENFNTVTVNDVRKLSKDFEKRFGQFPDLILVDYLELLEPGDGKRYPSTNEGERYRRQAISRRLKNLCMEQNTRVATATQASTVAPELLNNPNFYMTRYNVSEFKAIVDPFTVFLTYNQTSEEYKERCARIFIDKSRKSVGDKLISICQNYGKDKFYDRARTIEKFGFDTSIS